MAQQPNSPKSGSPQRVVSALDSSKKTINRNEHIKQAETFVTRSLSKNSDKIPNKPLETTKPITVAPTAKPAEKVKPEPVKPEPIKPELTKPEPTKYQPIKPEPIKTTQTHSAPSNSEPQSVSKLAILALMVAIGVGGVSYYYGNQALTEQAVLNNSVRSMLLAQQSAISKLESKQENATIDLNKSIEQQVTEQLSKSKTQLKNIADTSLAQNNKIVSDSLAKSEQIVKDGLAQATQMAQENIDKNTQLIQSTLATSKELQAKAAAIISQGEVNIQAIVAKAAEKNNAFLQQLDQSKQQFEVQQAYIAQLKQQLQDQKGHKPTDWLLAEVNYFVQLAYNQIRLERNVPAAQLTLTNAKSILTEVNDSKFNELLTAINNDLITLNNFKGVDKDRLTLQLLELQTKVAQLPPNKMRFDLTNTEKKEAKLAISSSAKDWKSNLGNSVKNFAGYFGKYTPPPEDGKIVNDLSPQLMFYVQENVKNGIGLAILAVRQENEALYHASIDEALQQIKDFYDKNSNMTTDMLVALKNVRNKQIKDDYPADLTARTIVTHRLQQTLHTDDHSVTSIDQGDK